LSHIKSVFTISDLENLTGISAHTIRIWERRYNLLSPDRTDTNLRRYTNSDLRKLLNIAALQKQGEKISRLALLSDKEMENRICELHQPDDDILPGINGFKLAMLEFDRFGFERTYAKLSATMGFEDLYKKVLIPLMIELGKLWQAGAICPAHEHFISNLIRQKLYSEIEKISKAATEQNDPWIRVLFLPPNEMHELGPLFLYYLLASKGKNTIYLGQSVETSDLVSIRNALKGKIIYISWWTIFPQKDTAEAYIVDFSNKILNYGDQLWITGNHLSTLNLPEMSNHIAVFNNPAELVTKLFAENN
jgi:DNA-binding transcriptional MerR regulator